jgi:3-deoxy-D-manno-octulosonic-acid transferase
MTSFLSIYKILTRLIHPLTPLLLKLRIQLNLESLTDSKEKIMIYNGIIRPILENTKILMIHSASLGEFNTIKSFIKAIQNDQKNQELFILLTTTTEAAKIAFNQEYQGMEDKIMQVYLPFDTPQLVQQFLNFWRIDYLLLVESEIWPNLISLLPQSVKMGIISGRMSDKSAKRWRLAGQSLPTLLQKMAFIGAGSERDYQNFKFFYPNTTLTGNLKVSAEPLPVNSIDLEEMTSSLNGKEVFVAASTHPGEEEMILEAYQKYRDKGLLIIAPRHKDRTTEIIKIAEKLKLNYRLRFTHDNKNNNLSGVDLYIVNSFGELGTFFALSKKVFLGGSLVPKIGGHNPCEPALFSCKIMTGPHYKNFHNLMNDMKREEALVEVANSQDLMKKFLEPAGDYGAKANNFIKARQGALEATITLLKTCFSGTN